MRNYSVASYGCYGDCVATCCHDNDEIYFCFYDNQVESTVAMETIIDWRRFCTTGVNSSFFSVQYVNICEQI